MDQVQNNTFSNCCLCVYVEDQGLTVLILGSEGLHSRGLKAGHTCITVPISCHPSTALMKPGILAKIVLHS